MSEYPSIFFIILPLVFKPDHWTNVTAARSKTNTSELMHNSTDTTDLEVQDIIMTGKEE